MIKDSGNRTAFATGAVRDIQVGKGRCDLLPLRDIAILVESVILIHIDSFQTNGTVDCLYGAINTFVTELEINKYEAILEVSKHYEGGCEKYGERNWEKGIPVERYIDSAVRHYLKWKAGLTDEHHDRAVLWNLLCAAWTVRNKPELNNYGSNGK